MRYAQMIFSPTGGTGRTAKILMSGLTPSERGGSVETIDLSDPVYDFSMCSFAPEDVVLIALPSYGGRVPAAAAERLSQTKAIWRNACCCACMETAPMRIRWRRWRI